MRKILVGILAASVLGVLVVPSIVSAAQCSSRSCEQPVPAVEAPCNCSTAQALAGEYCCAAANNGDGAVFDTKSDCTATPECAAAIGGAPGAPNECCQLANDVSKVNTACTKGAIVGPEPTAQCDIEGGVNTVTSAWAMCCTVDIVYKVTNWIFFIMLTISVLMVIAGGVIYMTAAGNTEKTGTGKNLILYAIVGLAIGILAKIIPSIVTFII